MGEKRDGYVNTVERGSNLGEWDLDVLEQVVMSGQRQLQTVHGPGDEQAINDRDTYSGVNKQPCEPRRARFPNKKSKPRKTKLRFYMYAFLFFLI